MNPNYGRRGLNSHEAQELMTQKPNTIFVDVLPPEHFAKMHLPGAKNACVYMVSFLDDISLIVPNKDAAMVLYGSSSHSRDVMAAMEKLDREGYRNMSFLEGGIAAWREAGYPLEGAGPHDSDDPQTRLALDDGIYVVDAGASRIEWAGRNPTTRHHGTVRIAGGRLEVENALIRGSVEVDMNTIHNINLEGDPLHPVLEQHLRSDDFFFVNVFPSAVFTITEGKPKEPAWLTLPNYAIRGQMSLRGVSSLLELDATINRIDRNRLAIESHFDMDRTQWNVIYGSARFFEHLGKHKVFDLVSIQVVVMVEKQW